MNMETLDDIFIANGTDKGSKHPVHGHNYADHYEHWFKPRRFDDLVFCEIGVGGGESVRSWLAYFESPEFRLIGADIVKDTNEWNTPDLKADPRYRFIHLNQEDEVNVKCFAAMVGAEFDIIVDDGAHTNTGIIASFNVLWPLLKKGGLYCIEDLGAGFTPGSVHIKPGLPPHKAWLHGIVDLMMTGPQETEFAYFSHELVILKKKA